LTAIVLFFIFLTHGVDHLTLMTGMGSLYHDLSTLQIPEMFQTITATISPRLEGLPASAPASPAALHSLVGNLAAHPTG
jgi:hypothetical protein